MSKLPAVFICCLVECRQDPEEQYNIHILKNSYVQIMVSRNAQSDFYIRVDQITKATTIKTVKPYQEKLEVHG